MPTDSGPSNEDRDKMGIVSHSDGGILEPPRLAGTHISHLSDSTEARKP